MKSARSETAVAIIGYSHRLPGRIVSDADFWRLLSEREVIQAPITERYGRGYQPIGGFSGAKRFASRFEGLISDDRELGIDYQLFGMSHNEMVSTDPQARMLLGCAWETIERAGWELHALRNSPTGVFIGAQTPATANWRPLMGGDEFTVPNVSVAMLANRISYYFNLTGASISCCTACSAGLSALHSALNALRCGDCEQALVGSVNYLGSARLSVGFSVLGVLSEEGRCHSFDAQANGYMRSEGAFVFAIKPLAAAERDGDHIHAVIEATAINAAGAADGAVGLAQGRMITAPTRHAQVELMRTARARAGYAPQDFDYIEAHATGTAVGDRIEGNAIAEAFSAGARAQPLRLSSVKSNLGHMEAAAFHCALLKVILMMQRRTFAPTSKNFLTPNPEIDFDSCPMQVQTTCEPFPERPVVCGINSFGFGGANGHCVVREYRPSQPRRWSIAPAPAGGFMLPLSARSAPALVEAARQLRESLTEQDIDLCTLAGNLGRRRTHFPARAAFTACDNAELLGALDAFVEEPDAAMAADTEQRSLAMVFTGQGAQWAGCGRALYEADPVFRRVIDAIEEHWREHSEVSLRAACFSAEQAALDECQLAQPVTFMLQCALFELYKTWGVHPQCVVGHSSGEVAAAYASGALSLAQATRLIYWRSTLQQRLAGCGRMLAIGLDRAGVEQLLEELSLNCGDKAGQPPQLEIACENAPASAVVCGKEETLQPLLETLTQRKLSHSLIPGNLAFHSTAMEPIRDEALAAFAFLDDCTVAADIPLVSSVTGAPSQRLDSAYWWSNIRQPVQFAAAMEHIKQHFNPDVILELAPHAALQTTIAQCLEDSDKGAVVVPALLRQQDVCRSFQNSLGALFKAGIALDFAAQYPRPRPVTHLLPGHPQAPETTLNKLVDDEFLVQQGPYSHAPLLGRRVPAEHPLFEAYLAEKEFPWLADHRVHHAAIMPGAGYIELVLEALEGVPVHFETIEFLQPCPIPETPVRLQTALRPVTGAPDHFTFTISSSAYDVGADIELHCRGKVRCVSAKHPVNVPTNLVDFDLSRFNDRIFVNDSDFYERLDAILSGTFQYGPYFRTIERVLSDRDLESYLFDVAMDEDLWRTGQEEGYVSCPPLFDGGLQIFLYHLLAFADLFAFPQRADNVTFLQAPSAPRITCHVTKPSIGWFDLDDTGQYSVRCGERSGGAISFYDSASGALLAHIGEYTYFTSNPRWADLPKSKHRIRWQPKAVPKGRALAARLPDGELAPAALLAALEQPERGAPYACHVIEFSAGLAPDETMLKQCIEYVSGAEAQTEFWLISDSEENNRAQYDAFHRHEATLRFEHLDLDDRIPELDSGLLRPEAAEILFLHHPQVNGYDAQQWKFLHRLATENGLALVRHTPAETVAPGAGWRVLRRGQQTTLLQAKPLATAAPDTEATATPRWVLGEPGSRSQDWAALLDADEVYPICYESFVKGEAEPVAAWPRAAELQAVDFFCGEDPQDPTGEQLTTHFISFAQALIAGRMEETGPWLRLTVVTQQAAFEVDDARGSALWGAVRSMAMEVGAEARIDFRLVDLGAEDDLSALRQLVRSGLRERELAVRKGALWAPRMMQIQARHADLPAGEEAAYRLSPDNPGQVAGLQMKTFEPNELAPDEVELEVVATALNFRDIMVTLDLLPGLAYQRSALGRELGMEASGIVRRVGSEVNHCAQGDAVAFIHGGSIANRLRVNQHLVFSKPDCLTMEQAASVLSVYVTAYYSLVHLARLEQGQRVLIHSAMGGVGQAAIALAKHVGAEIYATAGTEDKRKRLLELGARAAFDSHSHDWYDELMQATDGKGVDVALNSLSGRHIVLCLQALRPGGWHCEIGKVDIYADNERGLCVFRKNLRFAAIDVDRLMLDDPLLARRISQACLDLLEQGALPPLPVTCFAYQDYAEALRLMINGKHEGKLVLTAPKAGAAPAFPIVDRRPFLDPEATYLITGGLGGFGLRLLPYLVVSGARHLTLMDRDPQRRRDLEWLRRSSTLAYMDIQPDVDIVTGDAADAAAVQRCVEQLKRPLKGVFHLAGCLDDRLLTEMTPESVAAVFAPKAMGALNLHRATADCKLDHFVLFSSTAATFGNPGQVNYSAASAFLDGLAAQRRRQGLPGLSYNMAAIAEVGMAARNLHVLRLMRTAGMPPVSSNFAVSNLDYILRAQRDTDHLITALFQRPPWTVESADYMRSGRLIANQEAFSVASGNELTLEGVAGQIADKVAELCGHESGDVAEPLSSFGLNSISVAELGAFIQTQFNYKVSALELMTTASALSLAQAIIEGKPEADVTEEAQAAEAETGELPATPETRDRQQSSLFANAPEDYFPAGDGHD